jgi:V/A-type H+-transporting ATPase subunit E
MSELTGKLEGLLQAQAMGLAEQHLETGRRAASQIRGELEARLQRLRDGEEQRFQHEAEVRCRQLLQGAKLRMDADIDRMRWALAQDVLSQVRARMEQLVADPARYLKVLEAYLAEAAASLPAGDLVAELTPRDVEGVRAHWENLAARAAPGRKVALSPLAGFASGGMLVRSGDGRLRVDNTFEGRLERMQEEVLDVIMDQLFNQAGSAS